MVTRTAPSLLITLALLLALRPMAAQAQSDRINADAEGTPGRSAESEIRVRGNRFLLGGKPFDMWGIRTASASQTQALTEHLIAQLDDYVAHGVNTVSVYYMGSSGGYSDPFSPDGRSIDAAHQQRVERNIQAAAERGMVVIVGIFYQRCDAPRLRDWEAAREAVKSVAQAVKPYRNVIINIANEQNSGRYEALPWSRVREVPAVLELCRLVKTIDPERLVGAGGYDHRNNEVIGRSADVDVLLFDTAGPNPHSGALYERFVAAGVKEKPIVNVETFGAWTRRYQPPGVFPDEARQAYLAETADAAWHDGLYVHFHNNPWCQAAGDGGRNRYDLGGLGTKDDPGIRWYFEEVQQARSAVPEGGWRALPLIADGKVDRNWVHIGWGGFAVDGDSLRTECDEAGMGLLLYRKERLGNCQIRVVYRTKDAKSNAGVFVQIDEAILDRIDEKPPAVQRSEDGTLSNQMLERLEDASEKELGPWYAVHHGYEVQICDAADPYHRTGAIYSLARAADLPMKPAGGWRTMIITLDGNRIVVEIDGKRVSTFDPDGKDVPKAKHWSEPRREPQRPVSGYIGLQNHDPGDVVWFKEISVRPLKADR